MLLALLPAAIGLWLWWRHEKRWEKRKKRLILIMRALVVLLLILALARIGLLTPVREQTVVFVVDRSASVNDDEKALEMIFQAVAGKGPDDRFAVISAGAEPVCGTADDNWEGAPLTLFGHQSPRNRFSSFLAIGRRADSLRGSGAGCAN